MGVRESLTQAYVNCVDAEGNDVVASWNQVVTPIWWINLFYDDLYNGNSWDQSGTSPMDGNLAGGGAPAKSVTDCWAAR